jgi:Saxitoxin biosynthesis operon protein SxtJ
MALIRIKTQPSPREVRQFAAIWFPLFCLVVGWLIWRGTGSTILAGVVWSLAAVVCVAGYFAPRWMRYVFVGWMWAAYPIGWLISHLLLATIYYIVLTPIGLIRRATGRDPLERQFDRDCKTYWQPHTRADDIGQYFRQY